MGVTTLEELHCKFSFKGSIASSADLDSETGKLGDVIYSAADQSCYIFDGLKFIKLSVGEVIPEWIHPEWIHNQSVKITHCPNCGASIDLSASSHLGLYHCDYCDSFVDLHDERN